MADKYIMRVTAGPGYDPSQHVEVPVNAPETVDISGPLMDVSLNVRVRRYRGLPHGSPSSSPYFEQAPHAANDDTYSIAFRFVPKDPASLFPSGIADVDASENDDDAVAVPEDELTDRIGIPASDLQWGNDFDHPIRDRLPPGFNTALGIVRWWVDPGLEGDAYADRPYLYGPALSSFNAVHVAPSSTSAPYHDPARGGLWFDEGAGDEDALRRRRALGAPDDARARMRWALREEAKRAWVWEYGRPYGVDFYNGYLDFENFALRLPGFHLPIMKYWDGQSLRYVLRNRATGDVYLVVNFSLHLREDVREDGTLRPEALLASRGLDGNGSSSSSSSGGSGSSSEEDGEPFDEEKALEEARRSFSGASLGPPTTTSGEGEGTKADDVD